MFGVQDQAEQQTAALLHFCQVIRPGDCEEAASQDAADAQAGEAGHQQTDLSPAGHSVCCESHEQSITPDNNHP